MEEDRRDEGQRQYLRKVEMVICYIQGKRGRKGRWKRRRRRTETIIALSYHCTVINSLLSRGVSGQAGLRPDDKPPPPCTAVLAIYDQQHIRGSHEASRAPIHLGLLLSLLGPGDNLKWGYSVTSPNTAFDSDGHFSTSSSAYW